MAFLLMIACVAGCATSGGRWKKAQTADTIPAYREFLAAKPPADLQTAAIHRIAELQFAEARARDTIASYEQFLRTQPPADIKSQADSRIAALRKQEALARDAQDKQSLLNCEQSTCVTQILRQHTSWDNDPDVQALFANRHLGVLVPAKDFVAIDYGLEIKESTVLPGSGRVMVGDRFQNTTEERTAPKGKSLLTMILGLDVYGTKFSLNRDQVVVSSSAGVSSSPTHWEDISTGLFADDGFAFTVPARADGLSKLKMVIEVPSLPLSDLTLTILGTPVGTLAQIFPSAPNAEVIKAVEAGDAVALRRLLDAGYNPNAFKQSSIGWGDEETALMLAAHAGRLDLVRLLLEKGADANVAIKKREVSTGRNSSGGTDTTVKVIEWTALKAATENGNASIVELLRQAGATR
jgi:hypothetical protein